MIPQTHKAPPKRNKAVQYSSKFWFIFWSYFQYTVREICKRKMAYLLGVASCFVVVFSVAISLSTLSQVPIVFLRLAEINSGEFDLKIKASSSLFGTTLNESAIVENLKNAHDEHVYQSQFSFHSPRHEFAATAFQGKSCTFNNTKMDLQNVTWMYSGTPNQNPDDRERCSKDIHNWCIESFCTHKISVNVYAFDTEKEKRMEFGRQWDHPKIPKGKVYISQQIARDLNVKEQDFIVLQYNAAEMMLGPFRQVGIISNVNDSIPTVSFMTLQVEKIYNNPHGKISTNDEYGILMEYETFLSHAAEYLNPAFITSSDITALKSIEPSLYATQIHFNLPPSRLYAYNINDYDQIQHKITSFASRILYGIGFDQVDTSFPILGFMRITRFFSLFLALIINIIITILTILAIILIYSLLMINVENRTFELGVLRMVGMQRSGTVQLILIQSFCYAIPAWILGLLVGQAGYIGVTFILGHAFQVNSLRRMLSWNSILGATILGIIIPIISSILPIMNALGQNLRDSLDTQRSKSQAVQYEIERSHEGKISWSVIAIGLSMAIFGFMVYYAFPLSLLSFNITLLLYMFFGLLLAMLLGLIVLSLNLENILEHLTTYVFFFWENPAIRRLVLKNLVAHRIRNRKTTIMYALSLAFVIFIAVSFNLQIMTFRFENEQRFGTRLNIVASHRNGLTNQNLQAQLEKYCKSKKDIITGYTYMSFPLHNYAPFNQPDISNLGKYSSAGQRIRAISSNFYSVVRPKYLKISEQIPSGYSLDELLYTFEGSSRMMIGELYRDLLHLKDGLNSTFLINYNEPTERFPKYYYSLVKPLAFMMSSPAVKFSQFPRDPIQDAFVSFPSFVRLSKGYFKSVLQVPIERMFIEVSDSVTNEEVDLIKRDLRAIVSGHAQVTDVEERLQQVKIATEVMNFFFYFTTFIAMIMCFFSLASSMYTNINEQSKEIGVLRAIGTRKFFMRRLYVYESFILVFVASIMGFVIGTVIAYTMTIQRLLFETLPLNFQFPWHIMCIVIGMSAICAFLSSYFPIRSLTNASVVSIFRKV